MCAEATSGSVTSSCSVTASVGPVCAEASSGTVSASVGPVCAETFCGKADFVTDSLGWMHPKIPHTGPATICVRAGKYNRSSSETHCKDLKPQLDEV